MDHHENKMYTKILTRSPFFPYVVSVRKAVSGLGTPFRTYELCGAHPNGQTYGQYKHFYLKWYPSFTS